MNYARLDKRQQAALAALIRGRTVHDLGCGDRTLSAYLVQLGAAGVVAVDYRQPPGDPAAGVTAVRVMFLEFAASEPAIDVAFVSWPNNHVQHGLLELLHRSATVAYLGKNTDGVACGWPGLFRHFLARKLVAYLPHRANTLCVYGPPIAEARIGEPEEQAGLDPLVIRPYVEGAP